MKLLPILFILLSFLLTSPEGRSVGGSNEAIGTLPKTRQALLVQLSTDADLDGLSDKLEIITLQTDPLTPNPAFIDMLPDHPGLFNLLVLKPLTGTIVIIGPIPLSALPKLDGSEGEFPSAQVPSPPSQPQVPSSPGGSVGGVVFNPIEPPVAPPTVYNNQICYQETIPVGSVGGILEVQIQSSKCVPADNFSCNSNCSSQAGGTQQIIDPIALLGG